MVENISGPIQYLTFAINDGDYGVETAHVIEIIKMQPITKVPEMPNFIEGLIHLRGQIIGVLDLRKRFDMPAKAYDEQTCIILIAWGEYTLGMIVDAVRETIHIDKACIVPLPNTKLNDSNKFIRNVGNMGEGNVKLLIDVERLLPQD